MERSWFQQDAWRRAAILPSLHLGSVWTFRGRPCLYERRGSRLKTVLACCPASISWRWVRLCFVPPSNATARMSFDLIVFISELRYYTRASISRCVIWSYIKIGNSNWSALKCNSLWWANGAHVSIEIFIHLKCVIKRSIASLPPLLVLGTATCSHYQNRSSRNQRAAALFYFLSCCAAAAIGFYISNMYDISCSHSKTLISQQSAVVIHTISQQHHFLIYF